MGLSATINSPYKIENVIRNFMNESAKDVKNKAKATSAAPKNETWRKVNRLNTGPFARPLKHVSAWFKLIIVVIWADVMPRTARRSRKINPNCWSTGKVESWQRFRKRIFTWLKIYSHVGAASSKTNEPTEPSIGCNKIWAQLRMILALFLNSFHRHRFNSRSVI